MTFKEMDNKKGADNRNHFRVGAFWHPLIFFQFTLPNCYAMPSHCCQLSLFLFVSLYIAINLFNPKISIRFGYDIITAAMMSMPKTPVYKDTSAIFAKYNIRMTG